jgi:hypothetical protein
MDKASHPQIPFPEFPFQELRKIESNPDVPNSAEALAEVLKSYSESLLDSFRRLEDRLCSHLQCTAESEDACLATRRADEGLLVTLRGYRSRVEIISAALTDIGDLRRARQRVEFLKRSRKPDGSDIMETETYESDLNAAIIEQVRTNREFLTRLEHAVHFGSQVAAFISGAAALPLLAKS